MANLNLFASTRGPAPPAATSCNEAGGLAHARRPESALALYAATGCLNNTFYASAEQQLDHVLGLCAQVEPAFVAKTAIYTRQRGHMKDMPALLLASLTNRDGEAFERAFGWVIDNGRMLRNFVQIVRSGQVGRKSLGSRPKRLVRQWLDRASVDQLLNAAIGNQPSLADVVRVVDRQAGRRGGAAGQGACVRGVQALAVRADAEVADAVLHLVAVGRVALDSSGADGVVADVAHEPQHVSASWCVR
jgi:60 kDa SS-A/Ro ribonucleoprotein